MARSDQRLIFVLSLCLLAQLFVPAFTASVKKHHNKGDKSEKRSIFGTLKFLGSNALKGITFTANLVTTLATLTTIIAGCSEAEREWATFERLKGEYENDGLLIKEISELAERRQLYANSTFYDYRDTRDRVSALADEQTLVLRSMGPEAMIVLNNVTFKMERIFEEASKNDEQVDLLAMNDQFATDLERGLRLTFAGASVAMPGLKRVWKNHLKQSTVGKKITGFMDKFKTKLTQTSGAASQKVQKVLSKGVLGRATSKITQKLQGLINRVAPKFSGAKKIFGAVKSGLVGLAKIGTTVLSIWTAIESVTDCSKKAQAARESVAEMQKTRDEIAKQVTEIKKANQEVQGAWKDVYDVAMADNLLETLKDIKAMIEDDYFSTSDNEENRDEKAEVARRIQRYLDVKELTVDQESTKRDLSTSQREMNEVLGTVTVTLSCFKHKGNMFNTVKRACGRGDKPFGAAYQDAVESRVVNLAEKCQQRTGEEYITSERMQEAWENWAEANGTSINKVCLINSERKMESVTEKMQSGMDAQDIANSLLNEEEIENGGLEEVEAMIAKIKEDNPNVLNQLSANEKRMICNMKNSGKDDQAILEQAKLFFDKPNLTLADIQAVEC